MPGKNHTFTTRVDPVSPPKIMAEMAKTQKNLVEAPGTAPGSATLIP